MVVSPHALSVDLMFHHTMLAVVGEVFLCACYHHKMPETVILVVVVYFHERQYVFAFDEPVIHPMQ